MKKYLVLLIIWSLISFSSCSDDADATPTVELLSASINGATLSAQNDEVEPSVSISLVFSAALDPVAFREALSLSSGSSDVPFSISYTNGGTRALVEADLDFETTYTLIVSSGVIGANGGRLAQSSSYSIITRADGIIRSAAPCTSGCLQSLKVPVTGTDSALFSFYRSFDPVAENTVWEDLTSAVIVVHGLNRNGDDYFNYLTSALSATNLSDEVALISTAFRSQSEAATNELYWSGSGWREGAVSSGTNNISSFTVVDYLIELLANTEQFPNLDRVVVTGHSSGGLFTHTYAAANQAESTHSSIDFSYWTLNSQYFYYPSGERLNASNEVFIPSDCGGYDVWPQGFSSAPFYVSEQGLSQINTQYTTATSFIF